jgi:hypothetical protein
VGYVRTLTNFAPPPRLDGQPFTQMRVEESPTETGTWTLVPGSLVALNPIDADPAEPMLRSFTTDQATLPNSWLRVVFLDAQGDLSIGDAVNNQSTGVTGLASIADVRRALGNVNQSTVSDLDLLYYLNVAASTLENKLPQFTTPQGTSTFFGAPRIGMLWLPVMSAEVQAVRAYETNPGGATTLSSGKWDYAVQPGGIQTNPKLTGGMRSERIGDYSYTLSDKDVDEVMPARARKLLLPYRRRRHVFVT